LKQIGCTKINKVKQIVRQGLKPPPQSESPLKED
jgi:hypothetical protein